MRVKRGTLHRHFGGFKEETIETESIASHKEGHKSKCVASVMQRHCKGCLRLVCFALLLLLLAIYPTVSNAQEPTETKTDSQNSSTEGIIVKKIVNKTASPQDPQAKEQKQEQYEGEQTENSSGLQQQNENGAQEQIQLGEQTRKAPSTEEQRELQGQKQEAEQLHKNSDLVQQIGTSDDSADSADSTDSTDSAVHDSAPAVDSTSTITSKTAVDAIISEDQRILEEIAKEKKQQNSDSVNDGIFAPITPDPSCEDGGSEGDCWHPPDSTVETETLIDATCVYGGEDPSEGKREDDLVSGEGQETCAETPVTVDKHWGSDPKILKMRDRLRLAGAGAAKTQLTNDDDDIKVGAEEEERSADTRKPQDNRRPPIFLMPGLAATRLVSWRHKSCGSHPLLGDVKIQDYVWLNINFLLQMATIDDTCFKECMMLGRNQSDTNDIETGCKLRADEGLDAIASLAPGSISSNVLVGGTNTVYAWLIQWLADNLGYDVSSIVGLPYDWRLSPDVMEKRDGFLTLTRRRIEAAVKTNGEPGILVAHSMGNAIFRYFLEWLRSEMRQEAYAKYVRQSKRRAASMKQGQATDAAATNIPGWMGSLTHVPDMDKVADYSLNDRLNTLAKGFDDLWRTFLSGNDPDVATDGGTSESSIRDETKSKQGKQEQLWQLAQIEGDAEWIEWIDKHIWTYVGLSAPLLGAVNPLRAVLSGEKMSMPISDEVARAIELSFGSTHTVNPVSTKMGFCDQSDDLRSHFDEKYLACLDDLIPGIEAKNNEDPWANFPALRALLKDRFDWDTRHPLVTVLKEECDKSEKPPCKSRTQQIFGARDVQNGDIFEQFNKIWKEEGEPLIVKKDQLDESWWRSPFPNPLNSTWDRPHIKHVIMAYGVDVPTEIGYIYRKESGETPASDDGKKQKDFDGIPPLQTVLWEEANGKIVEETLINTQKSLTESVTEALKIKPKMKPLDLENNGEKKLLHSGDGSVPYLSLIWAHTWLLHSKRAIKYVHEGDTTVEENALDSIVVSHRPEGGSSWISGIAPATVDKKSKKKKDDDTGTSHPHGTKYKPEMVRYQNRGMSRTTGGEYSTTVIEAIGVEHKETTRNYDILAAVFTDVLNYMHEDFGLV